VLSSRTAGCNLTCRLCQNWITSKSRDADPLAERDLLAILGDAERMRYYPTPYSREGHQELRTLPKHPAFNLDDALAKLSNDDALELGQRAARSAVAPLAWRVLVGETLDTTQVAQLLGVSRQAIAKRVRTLSLLGLPGRGITHFPVWQFDLDRSQVKPSVKEILSAFAEALESFDPVVASWARSPQGEDLEGLTPEERLQKGLKEDVLVEAAKSAAAALAK
jgi:hypothetical protein